MTRRPRHDGTTLARAAGALRRVRTIALGLGLGGALIQAAVLAYGDYGDEPAPATAASTRAVTGVSSGVFHEDQVEAGRTVFAANCVGCHGQDLGGGFGPPLNPLSADWSGQSLGSLYRFVSTNMPMDAPGSLGGDEYASVIAFVLAENGYPAGEEELPADDEALNAFVIDEPPSQD